jgi:hypothetical protein
MMDATPLLRAYALWRERALARQQPAACQETTLLRLVRRAMPTRFGRTHGFDRVRCVADFQARVPLRRYEDFWRDYWSPSFPRLAGTTWPDPSPFLALTSGTAAGRTKYLPVTAAMSRSNRRAALETLVHHLRNRPGSHILAGNSFMLGGSTALTEEAPGIRSGDLSGIAAASVPRWARPWFFPPPELALVADWEHKIASLAPRSLEVDIRSISGTPSWLLMFFERLAALRPYEPHRLARFYPDLALLVHGGVSFAPYRERFAAWLEGSSAELREVYAASEGFIAVADRGPDEGMRLLLDTGLFFEFVPASEIEATMPTRRWIGNAETGVDYALVLSTCAGLWSYVVGDTVRLVDRDPPRLLVTGRTSYFLSAFGEHVSGEELEQAVTSAAQVIGRQLEEFAAGPVPIGTDDIQGQHVFVVEFIGGSPPEIECQRFATIVDQELSQRNDDYRAHRQGGQMLPPRIETLPPGSFEVWMKSRGRLGGQNKVPRVITDAQLLATLRALVKAP